MFRSKYARRVRPWSFSMLCRWRHWGRGEHLLPLQRHTRETSLSTWLPMPVLNNKSVALQLRRAKTEWSGCCQMAVQGTLRLAKRYPSTLISVFLTGFRYFSYQVATQLASRGWVDYVPDPILTIMSLISLPLCKWTSTSIKNQYKFVSCSRHSVSQNRKTLFVLLTNSELK